MSHDLESLMQRLSILESRVDSLQGQTQHAIDLYRRIQVEDEATIRRLEDEIRKIKQRTKP